MPCFASQPCKPSSLNADRSPCPRRDALGLTKGTTLRVVLDGGRIILRKNVDVAISRARGGFKLDGFATTDEAMCTIRGRAPGGPLDT